MLKWCAGNLALVQLVSASAYANIMNEQALILLDYKVLQMSQ